MSCALDLARDIFRPGDIAYFHGLRSGVDGPRSLWMRDQLGADLIDYEPHDAIEESDAARARGEVWQHPAPREGAAFNVPLDNARRAVRENDYRLLVGASFGAMLITQLLHDGLWTGPTILLSCAAVKLAGVVALPPGSVSLIVHGREDDLVDIADARRLAASPDCRTELWELDDGHRLLSLFEGDDAAIALGLLRIASMAALERR